MRHPRVVATIGSEADWLLAEKINPHAPDSPDLLEVRADLLLQHSPKLPGDIVHLPLPIILTVRHPSEGGKSPVDPGIRRAIYQRFWENVAAIDLELSTSAELDGLIVEARKNGIACLLSYHHFSDTPTLDRLRNMTTQAANQGADLFKVATTTDNVGQFSTLLSWLENEKHLPLAAMGMGRLGKIFRPLLAQLGSRLNYGYLDTPLVPGQWPAQELRRVIDSLS